MCGRFNVIDNPGLQQLLRDLGIDLKLPGGANIAPTETISIVRMEGAATSISAARWWLVPGWAKEIDQKYSMFNARSEKLAASPAFRRPFASQRGLVPMSSFIEWRLEQGVKQPWLITTPEKAISVAALWDVWEGGDAPLLSCALVTTAAAPQFEGWHKRMPVILVGEERERWIDNSRKIAVDDPLFRSELKAPLVLQRLSPAVNSSRNKAEELLQGVGDTIDLVAQ